MAAPVTIWKGAVAKRAKRIMTSDLECSMMNRLMQTLKERLLNQFRVEEGSTGALQKSCRFQVVKGLCV
jgi:hypothetical protein